MVTAPTALQVLKFQAKLLAPTCHGNNESMAKFDGILDRLASMMEIADFEDFCSKLSRAHVGNGYTA